MSAIHSLVEVDVTNARTWVREFRNNMGKPLSFTSFLTFCLARAVDDDLSPANNANNLTGMERRNKLT